MKLSIILVNFKNPLFLKKCLESINKNSFKNLEIIIVNNEEDQLKLKAFSQLKITIIENKKNLGFGKACNIGTKKAQGKYLFFLNPDTELLTENFSSILKEFEKNPEIGIIGTQIIEKNKNQPQPWTCGKKTSFLRILFKNSINKPWNKKIPTSVDWVSGTSFFIKKTDFQKLKGFDEKFFMYFEDQDLCLRIKNLNKRCLFYPYFSVLHHNGKSWSNDKEKKKHYYQSQDYFFKKHFNRLSCFLLSFTKKILNK